MNRELNHNSPLREILKHGSMLDILRLCRDLDPRFIAPVLRQATYNQLIGKTG